MTHVIEVHKLCKWFGEKHVLTDIDLTVTQGESLVVIGGSGTGKSVLFKSIIGLMKPTSGEVSILGKSMAGLSEKEHYAVMDDIGVLFQGGALFDSLLVWENVSFSPLQHGQLNRHDAKDLAIEKLSAVGLDPSIAHLYPAELSGGMQKRVALARTIATNPKIIFFDEPTSGLDPIMTDTISRLIIKCSQELGATTVTISHDMSSVRTIADRVALIHNGRFEWVGPAKMLDHSDNECVEQFVHGKAEGPMTTKDTRIQ